MKTRSIGSLFNHVADLDPDGGVATKSRIKWSEELTSNMVTGVLLLNNQMFRNRTKEQSNERAKIVKRIY